MFISENVSRLTKVPTRIISNTEARVELPSADGGVLPSIVELFNENEIERETMDFGFDSGSTFTPPRESVIVPRVTSLKSVSEGAYATVIHIWEGTVKSVDFERSVMDVCLDDRGGLIASHLAEISLEWVCDQDRDLLEPGAVFYWTMYKETNRGGSIKNSEEIRFRRLPNWTGAQLANVQIEAAELEGKFSSRVRIAE